MVPETCPPPAVTELVIELLLPALPACISTTLQFPASVEFAAKEKVGETSPNAAIKVVAEAKRLMGRSLLTTSASLAEASEASLPIPLLFVLTCFVSAVLTALGYFIRSIESCFFVTVPFCRLTGR